MYAQLGNIIFESVIGPNAFGISKSMNYVEQPKILSKPALQKVGESLDSISLTFRFNVIFCNPAEQIRQIEDYYINSEVLPFISGNGEFFGNFVITSLDKTFNKTTGDGVIIDAILQVSLKEYFSEDLLADRQQAAVENAPAIERTTNLPNRLQLQQERAQIEAEDKIAAKSVTETTAEVSKTTKAISAAKNGLKSAKKAISDATKTLRKTAEKVQTIKSHVLSYISLYENSAKIINDCDVLSSSIADMVAALGTGDINNAFAENDNLNDAMFSLTRSGSTVVSTAATRLQQTPG